MHFSRRTRIFRTILLSRQAWRKRLVFWLGAGLVGLVASWFALSADAAHDMFQHVVKHSVFWPLLLTPLGFGCSAWAAARYFPMAPGSGIPQTIAARILRDDRSRGLLLGMKVVIAKMLLTLLGLACGASVGREGPTIQVGAGILLLCASLSGLRAQRGVVLAGAAAGVAAAFNTPLAGIVFAIEEMARAFEHRNSAIVLTAIVLAGAASMSIMGNYNYFGYTAAEVTAHDWPAVLTVGILGGVLGSVFARCLIDGDRRLRALARGFNLGHPAVFAGLCGLGVALLGLLTHGVTYGTGYTLADTLLHGSLAPAWWQTPAKFAATALSAISGIPGGIFSPSLSVGAALGGEVAGFFPHTSFQAVVLLGMVAYFAGVTQAPITAFVIVLEVTGKGTSALPLMAAGILAAAIGRLLCPTSLYHALAKQMIGKLRDRAPAVPVADTPRAA